MAEKDNMTQFILQKQAEGRAETTLDGYSYALKDWLQYLYRNKIAKATCGDIRDYFIYLRNRRYSVATIHDKWRILSVYYRWCARQGLCDNIMTGMAQPPREKRQARCFSDAEVQKIMTFIGQRDDFVGLRDMAVICLLLGTGLRRSELLSIVSIDGETLTVIGKGNKQRSVPVAPVLRERLRKYTEARASMAHTPYYIVNKDGGRLTKNGLRAIFTRLSHATGIGGRRFSSHTCRHYYATRCLANGMDIASLQRILGHADLATTALYLNWSDDTAKESNAKANPLNNFFGKFNV